MSTAGYLRQVEAVRRQHLRSAAQISIGALVVILLLMHWRLVRPLDRLVQASGRIEQGQLDVPIRPVFPMKWARWPIAWSHAPRPAAPDRRVGEPQCRVDRRQ